MRHVVLGFLFLIGATCCAGTKPDMVFKIERLAIQQATSSEVVFQATLLIRGPRDARLRSLRFEQLSAGDIPVFVDPITSPITLKREGRAEPGPVVTIHLYRRDVNDLASIADIWRQNRVRVRGLARLMVEVPLAARLALWESQTELLAPVDRIVPLDLQHSPGVATVAYSGAKAADILGAFLHPVTSRLDELAQPEISQLTHLFRSWPVTVKTRYQLRRPDGTVLDLGSEGQGFRCASGKLITTRENLEPWRYREDLAVEFHGKRMSLVEGSVEVEIRGLDGRGAPYVLRMRPSPQWMRPDTPATRAMRVLDERGKMHRLQMPIREDVSNVVEIAIPGLDLYSWINSDPIVASRTSRAVLLLSGNAARLEPIELDPAGGLAQPIARRQYGTAVLNLQEGIAVVVGERAWIAVPKH